jgi:hypothetical protein
MKTSGTRAIWKREQYYIRETRYIIKAQSHTHGKRVSHHRKKEESMKRLTSTAGLLILVLFVTAVIAQPDTWKLLGKRTVKFTVDKDVINSGVLDGVFKAIKLKVKNSGVNIHDIKVYFRNGEVMDVQVRARIPKNGETRIIDLPGNNRIIDKVVFWYDSTERNPRRAVVELWGMR